VAVQQKVLSENDRLAAGIRNELNRNHIVALNLVSSPGSGKTSLLERTLSTMRDELNIAVIAGDVQTENDANRLSAAGGRIVHPIVTGGRCHLDAQMIQREIDKLDLRSLDLLFIENVGNLVCPSSYDLGEDMKVVLISTTEGDDKPLKYPGMFRRSSAMVINKIDLLESCDFSMEAVRENAMSLNGNLRMFDLSCRTGEGLDTWYDWLRVLVRNRQADV
jgi:hydrogenase nickel incorporation protein HypB